MTKYDNIYDMPINKDILDLQNLGFTSNDATIYLKLIELGIVGAGAIITSTGLHRNIVYTSLDHLITRKLVDIKEVKGKKTFSAIDPSVLSYEFKEKERIADEIVKRLNEKISNEKQEITIHEGNDEYLAVLSNLLLEMPKGSTKYVLGTGGQDFMDITMLPIWNRYHRIAHEQKISIKMIGYELQRSAIEPYTMKEKIYDIKYLPSNMENPAGIHIYPEVGVVLNIIYSTKNTPVTIIKIKNFAFVSSHLSLFKNLWNIAVT